MKRPFSRAFDPPAPVVPVRLSAPGTLQQVDVEGKVDTGADLCAVPESLVSELDLIPVRMVRAAGFAGVLVEVPAYRVDVEVGGWSFARVEAVATRRRYVIVGRNVLRHLVVRFDGPKERLDMTRGAKSR